jgi:hypothetical protein
LGSPKNFAIHAQACISLSSRTDNMESGHLCLQPSIHI